MVAIGGYKRVKSVDEVLSVFQTSSMPVWVIAGGTDLLTRNQVFESGQIDSSQTVLVVDISGVRQLAGISLVDKGLRIGAATKLADIASCDMLTGVWRVLVDGAARVGSPQIRNLATIGGNICNASPAADTMPPLLVLDAEAEMVSPRGHRVVSLVEFIVGPGRTILEEDEILTSVLIPNPMAGAVATYIKHSPRRAMDLAVVGVAALLAQANGQLEARIALGAVAPTPLRARQAEKFLAEAQQIDEDVIAKAARLAAQAATPISDVRASADYRAAIVSALTERALRQLWVSLS